MAERADPGAAFWADADEMEALQRYRTLVNAIDDGIYQLDAEGRFVAVNDVIAETTGYDREELIGSHVSLILDADAISAIEGEIARRLVESGARRETFEFAVETADGGRVPCELRLNLLVEGGEFRGTIGVARDVGEQRETERLLTERERQLARESDLNDRILEASPVGIMVIDSDGKVARVNERGRELLGISEDERGEYTPSDRPTYDEDGRPISSDEHPFAEALATGEPVYDRTLRVELPDGEHCWLSVNAVPILTSDGDVDRVVTTGEDVTDLKERERRLETELSELFGRVSDPFYALDEEFRFVHVNEAAEELIGRPVDDLRGELARDVLAEDGESELYDRFREAMETQESISFERYSESLSFWGEFHLYPSETGLSVCFRDITERKNVKRELRERERQLSTLMDNIPGMVYRCRNEPDWPMEFVSEGCRELTGYDPEVFERGEVSYGRDVVVEHDREDLWRELQDEVTDDEPFSVTYRIETADGDVRWVEEHGRGVFEDGDPVVLEGVAIDVTERQRLKAELEEIFGRVTDAFYALDADWQFTHVNDRAEELIDYQGGGLVGEDFWDVFEWAEGSTLGEQYRTAMETQEPTAFEFYYPEPLDAWHEVHAYPSETGLSVYFRDVTERKLRERELEESERRHRTLAEYFPNGIVTLFDLDLEYTLAAGRGFDEIPVEPEDLEGKHFREVWDEDIAADLEPVFEAALDGEERSVEFEYVGREWVVHAVPITDEHGDVFAGMTMAQDITERIERERKLEETVEKLEESNERLESFASMLAHELRNPVAIGQIYGQQLPAETDAEAVEYVTEAFDRIEDMIDVMLVLTRGREAVSESNPISLGEAAWDAWNGMDTPEADVEVNVDSVIQADETYVRHLLRNLFENAVQHGGEDVTVEIGDLPSGFYVADDGAGIPPDDRDSVFEAGFTTASDEGGTGLGLAFVEELAGVYDWSCTVTESDASGARFEFRHLDLVGEE